MIKYWFGLIDFFISLDKIIHVNFFFDKFYYIHSNGQSFLKKQKYFKRNFQYINEREEPFVKKGTAKNLKNGKFKIIFTSIFIFSF